MALNSTEEWQQQAEPWMLDTIRQSEPPEQLSDTLVNEAWASVYYFFAKSEYNTENVDFIAAVDDFKRSGSMDMAKQIYNRFVPGGAPEQINISSDTRTNLEGIFKDQEEPVGPPNLYEAAYDEIYRLVQSDSYARFKRVASQAHEDLNA